MRAARFVGRGLLEFDFQGLEKYVEYVKVQTAGLFDNLP